MFAFRPEVAQFVAMLANLIMFANEQDTSAWSNQTSIPSGNDGVYGRADKTLLAIIAIECGPQVAGRVRIEYGCYQDFYQDVCGAVQEALDEIAEEQAEYDYAA